MIGPQDIAVEHIREGTDQGMFRIPVQAFDYYKMKTGDLESGSAERLAIWMREPEHDGHSLFVWQVFFVMLGAQEGCGRLAHNLRAEIDSSPIEFYRGGRSLPFEPGRHGLAASKILDARGIESLKTVELAL